MTSSFLRMAREANLRGVRLEFLKPGRMFHLARLFQVMYRLVQGMRQFGVLHLSSLEFFPCVTQMK